MSATNRNGTVRSRNDFYPTPDWLTQAILPYLPISDDADRNVRILEPAAGNGALLRVLLSRWPNAQYRTVDIEYTRDHRTPPIHNVDHTLGDFLTVEPEANCDVIITNPPFRYAKEFIERSFLWCRNEDSWVVMLLRLNFLGSQKRGKWLREHLPAIFVTPRRPPFAPNKNGQMGTDATEYAWFVWGKGAAGLTILHTDEVIQDSDSDRRRRRRPIPGRVSVANWTENTTMDADKLRDIYGDRKCANPECDRNSGRALYCCRGCTLAHEGHYKIHEDGLLGHSEQCQKRASVKTEKD